MTHDLVAPSLSLMSAVGHVPEELSAQELLQSFCALANTLFGNGSSVNHELQKAGLAASRGTRDAQTLPKRW